MVLQPMAKKKRKPKQKFYSKGRVKRGPAPFATLTRTTYRKARPELRRDFNDRCAYCMRHIGTETEMQIDHFDPRKKKDKIQVYDNLFLSDAHCNGAKQNMWPTDEEQRLGCRFLNCCDEQDYGESIFEDPRTHELVGTTPAAIYHIDAIDLNDPELIDARKRRSVIFARLGILKQKLKDDPKMKQIVDQLRDDLECLIPDIPPPPHYWTIT